MAIPVWVDMAINMANIGVPAKNRKQEIFCEKGPKMADFLRIFCQHLKLMATSQFCEQNSEFFFGGIKNW